VLVMKEKFGMSEGARRKRGGLAVAAAGLAAVALSVGYTPAKADTLTISIWGGGYGAMWKKHVAERFEKATGHKIVVDGGRSSVRLSKLIAT